VLTVLHDLPVALRADRVLVLEAGQLHADGPPTDPQVQRTLERVFEQAIRIDADAADRPRVALVLDEAEAAGDPEATASGAAQD
jgi:iron complex transport system ATP-binding protein